MEEVLYRYYDQCSEPTAFPVIKITRAGKRIQLPYSDKTKMVYNTTLRRYAHETKEAALVAFIARKKRQIVILEGNLSDAKMALYFGEKLKDKQ